MDRRRFLTALTSTTALPLAGCSLPTDAKSMPSATTYHDPDAGDYVYEYGPGDTQWAQYAVEFARSGGPDDPVDVTLVVTGSDRLATTDLRFVVEPAPNVVGTVPEVRYLAKSWPPVTVSGEGRRTVLDVGGIDDPVDATLHFDLTVDPVGEGMEQVFVVAEGSFTSGEPSPFGRYRLRESEVYDLPAPRSA
ncbi:hypothetical protein [Halomarina litorea]|uniref:hypothetical protein n=1 Tax=Halomarina litorea TaxID=2961595 RepID=UPI0020C29C6D|nr:hypothetical protein [Halomarina sp. BCD28]